MGNPEDGELSINPKSRARFRAPQKQSPMGLQIPLFQYNRGELHGRRAKAMYRQEQLKPIESS